MDDTHKQAISTFEDEWCRYCAFTSGLVMRETPLDESDLARLSDAVNQLTLAREKSDLALGIGAAQNCEGDRASRRAQIH